MGGEFFNLVSHMELFLPSRERSLTEHLTVSSSVTKVKSQAECLMLVGFHTIPLLTFDLQVKLFTHQPPSNDGGWFW